MTDKAPGPGFKSHIRWARKPKPDEPSQAPTGVQSVEPDKPYVPGFAQPHQRAALKVNVEGEAAQRHPETPAGQHATGSFTGSEQQPAEEHSEDPKKP
jgi:hypothetical protein